MSGKQPSAPQLDTTSTKSCHMVYWGLQCFINDVLRECLGQCVIAYIDNILIYSPDLNTHVSQVSRVLQLLRKSQLYVKGENVSFTYLQYLS